MPVWFQEMVTGLLTDVRVSPILPEAFDGEITITRGVKQGCPLSPLLFIICYDPLLARLQSEGDHTLYGFADDLAASCNSRGALVSVLNIFRDFTRLSGLAINEEKTVVVAEKRLWEKTRNFLDINEWKDIALADNGIYLGIKFGNVTTEMIYEKALKKFRKRFGDCRPILRTLPIHKRTLLANVFLLTLFSYVGQFYVVPVKVYSEVTELLRKAVIPFNGGAFAYAHLVNVKTDSIRVANPLKDLWALNMTWLACKNQLDTCHGLHLAKFENSDSINSTNWGTTSPWLSMRPKEHRVHAALVYLDDYGDRKDGAIQSNKLNLGDKTTRTTVYNNFASKGWNEHLASNSQLKLRSKLRKWGVSLEKADSAAKILGGRAGNLRTRVTTQAWDFLVRLIFRALPFGKRLTDAKMKDNHGKDFRNTCYFCGNGEDSAFHVYKYCQVVIRMRNDCLQNHEDFDLHRVLLTKRDMTLEDTKDMLNFNYAIWRIRQDYLSSKDDNTSYNGILERVRIHFEGAYTGEKVKRDITERLANFLENPPVDASIYYTDGSASPNPGPCGAGFHRPDGPLPELSAATSLGHGTNNIGELYAMGMALKCIVQSYPVNYSCILTDSDYVYGLMEDNNRIKTNRTLVLAVKDLLFQARRAGRVYIGWIKAHNDYEGNEKADLLAKEGAKGTDVAKDTTHLDFLF
jgi:ribonuclease HI